MKTYTLDEMRTKTGLAAAHIVRKWREETPVDGKLIKMKEIDGEKRWWIEGDEEPAKNEKYELTLEEAKKLRAEGNPASVDVAKLSPEDQEAFKAWLPELLAGQKEEGSPVENPKKEQEEEEEPEITREWLLSIAGIGDKAADGVIDGCKEKGITELTDLVALDLTKFPGVGKGNGANLRAAIEKRLGQVPERFSCEHCGDQYGHQPKTIGRVCQTCKRDVEVLDSYPRTETAYPSFIYDLPAEEVALAKRWVDARRAGEPTPKVKLSDSALPLYLDWEDEEFGVEIRCPHCDGLFARVAPGAFESGEAICQDEDGDGEYGDCGGRFMVTATATDHGYEVSPIEAAQEEAQVEDAPEEPAQTETAHQEEAVAPAVDVECTVTASEEESTVSVALDTPEEEDVWGDEDWTVEVVKKKEPRPYLPMAERVHPCLPECRVLALTEAHTEEWHATRAKGIGSSDAGAILGLSPHAGPEDVWKTKVGQETDNKPWLEDYSEFGSWFEPFLRQHLEIEFGIEIVDGAEIGTLQSIHYPQALANIDGLEVFSGTLEEYKTTTEKWETIPLHYEAQCQHQMYVTGAEVVRLRQFVCPVDRALVPSLLEKARSIGFVPEEGDRIIADWLLEKGEIHTWIIERDDDFIERMVEAMKMFWDFVKIEVPPPPKDPEGTIDLSEDPEVVAACEELAVLEGIYENHIKGFLEAQKVDPDAGRGSAGGKADKIIKAAKTKARRAIEKAISVRPEGAKRVTIGDHKATLVERSTHSYWNIYKGDSDVIPF